MRHSITFITIAVCFSSLAQAQQMSRAAAVKAHPNWVQVPGAYIRPDCVHEIPLGANVEVNGDITLAGSVIAHYDSCPEAPILTRGLAKETPKFGEAPSPGNGWVEDIEMVVPLKSGDSVDEITGTWTVPAPPLENGALIYIFNGLEPTSGGVIIQPVLQYGATTAGGLIGGNYWTIAGWLVNSNAYHSPGVKVSTGDTIRGTTYVTSESAGKLNWEIFAQDTTSGAYSWLSAWSEGIEWNWAFSGVLETYGMTSCSEFPASLITAFANTTVYHGYPSFEKVTPGWYGVFDNYFGSGGPSCGFAQIPDGTVNFLFY